MKDENQVQRVITRMMELGILPPEEGMKVIDTGVFPSESELKKARKLAKRKEEELHKAESAFKKARKPAEMKEEELRKAESMLIQEDYDLPPKS